MPNTILQTNATNASGGTSVAVNAFGSNPTSGSRLILAIGFETPTVSTISVSDNQNGTYVLDYDSGTLAGSGGNGGGRILFYSVANTYSGASLAVSATWITSSTYFCCMFELAGGNASWFDAGWSASGTSTSSALSFSATPSHPNETLIVYGMNFNNPNGTAPDSGYTLYSGTPSGGAVDWNTIEYLANAGAVGAKSLSLNGSVVSGGASMVAVGYRTAGDSGSTTPQPMFYQTKSLYFI